MSTSTKPYLLRALYEWCLDNGNTPHLAVEPDEHTRIPAHLAKQEQVVFNIGPTATPNLRIDNDWISFSARFNGVSQEIWIPVGRVSGIFSRETGEGMGFAAETPPAAEDTQSRKGTVSDGNTADKPKTHGPRLVK